MRLVEAGDIEGVVSEHTRYVDGSERFGVQYWERSERKFVACERREIAPVTRGK